MKAKETLFHINWGDGDTFFVIAPDEKTAIKRMPDGKEMVNYVVKLDAIYEMIFRAGIREVVEWILYKARKHVLYKDADDNGSTLVGYELLIMEFEWQTKLKEWGIK